MDWRNRIGLYGSYFLGMAGIGFTLPYLPLYLGQEGLSDRAIGIISTLAALAGLAQFPIGVWSDRLGRRKPFLLAALTILAAATVLIRGAHGAIWLGALVVLFAENGICRSVAESLTGAEAATLAPPERVGEALGALRFWKPVGIIAVALAGSWIAERGGVGSILGLLIVTQTLAAAAVLLIRDPRTAEGSSPALGNRRPAGGWIPRDRALWTFIAAMVLFHAANAPGGVYLGLFLRRSLHAPERLLAYAFIVSMFAWMCVVWPAGRLADRYGRRPLLIACWTIMAARLAVVSIARSPEVVLVNQALDGAANGLFAVLAAAWVTDRLADPARAGEAQVIVGTSLVLGSAIGPALSGLAVDALGYRALFAALAGVGAVATAILVVFVPETRSRRAETARPVAAPLAAITDLSPSA
jgi:MFS family permease